MTAAKPRKETIVTGGETLLFETACDPSESTQITTVSFMTHKSGHMCAPHLSAREQIGKHKHCDSKIDAVTQHNEKKNMYVYVGRSCDFNRRQHPSKTFHKDIRDCREAQEGNHSNRLCSTIFIDTAFRETSWCTARKISVPLIATDSSPANGGPTRACN